MKIQLLFPICSRCIHLDKKSEMWSCKAFPGGIPDEILLNEFDHTKKYPGQKNDIIFEAVEKEKNEK